MAATSKPALVAANIQADKRLWQTTKLTDNHPLRSWHATAFLNRHEKRFFLFNELSDFILPNLTLQGYE